MELKAVQETLALPSRAHPPGNPVKELLASESAKRVSEAPRPEPQSAERSADTQARLERAVAQMNEAARIFNKELDFKIDEGTGRMKVSVIDSQTGELLAELPPQRILDVAARIQEQVGILLDEFA